jgi:hypothetical protein
MSVRPAYRTRPSFTVTRPEVSFSAPQVSLTVNAEIEMYQNLTALSETLKTVSAEWGPTEYSCDGHSCTAGFVDTSGNTMTVKSTLYDTTVAAKAAYETAKQQASNYRMTALEAGDDGHLWQHLNKAGAGVLEKNEVFLIDYMTKSGPADTEDVTGGASALAGNQCKYS